MFIQDFQVIIIISGETESNHDDEDEDEMGEWMFKKISY